MSLENWSLCTDCRYQYQSLNPAIVFDVVLAAPSQMCQTLHPGGGATAVEDNTSKESSSLGVLLRPESIEVVTSRVAGWDAARVGAWLDTLVPEPALEEAGSSDDPQSSEPDLGEGTMPLDAAAVLRGLDGPSLLALRPTGEELELLDRKDRAGVIRAIRWLEAAETN